MWKSVITSAVLSWVVLATATVRSGWKRFRLSADTAASRSKAMHRSASPAAILLETTSTGWSLMMKLDSTAPPFCARPVWSRCTAYLPSMAAAVTSSASTVTTPVPPMPISMVLYGRSHVTLSAGSGRSAPISPAVPRRLAGPASGPRVTVMNAGQSPCRQE